jgi:hypothetical protein
MEKKNKVSMNVIVARNLERLMKKAKTNSYFLAERTKIVQNRIDGFIRHDPAYSASVSELETLAEALDANFMDFFKK